MESRFHDLYNIQVQCSIPNVTQNRLRDLTPEKIPRFFFHFDLINWLKDVRAIGLEIDRQKTIVSNFHECCGVSQIFMICNSDARPRRHSPLEGFKLCIHRMHAVR